LNDLKQLNCIYLDRMRVLEAKTKIGKILNF